MWRPAGPSLGDRGQEKWDEELWRAGWEGANDWTVKN